MRDDNYNTVLCEVLFNSLAEDLFHTRRYGKKFETCCQMSLK